MNGILLINKEKGMTSHDVVHQIKKILNINKIGHVGTLDPNAIGLLVVLLNEATKLADYLIEDQKEYVAEVVIGESTTTEDGEGQVTSQKTVSDLGDVDVILSAFIGKQTQIPPMYSAIKIQGKKLYELARKGFIVDRKPRSIEIFMIKRTSVIEYQDAKARFSFYVKASKGTYVRTLCVDIGKSLNYPARMGKLQRLTSGKFSLVNAFSLDDVRNGRFQLVDMLTALDGYPQINVNDEQKKKIGDGVALEPNELKCDLPLVVLRQDQQLLAIYKLESGKYRAKRVWK
ncbi:MAG TPA: tRNA pseudouridine(55) synthase TruB [Acholeplasmatales bacterium]|nr:tRNA pseudouridine(55) synthase TruB [Acholeplasmatales bacterium]